MFSIPENATLININMGFSLWIVIASIVVGIVGTFTAFSCEARAGQNILITKTLWNWLASISLAIGVWVLHFIGMAAIRMPVTMSHNIGLTAVSILPALVAAFIAFYVINLPRRGFALYILASVTMGIGVTCMHLIGIYAMTFDGIQYYFEPLLFFASILISIIGSFIALYTFSSIKKHLMMTLTVRMIAAVILGIAVAVLHYGNILSMKFYISPDKVASHGLMGAMEMNFLAAGLTIGIVVILMLLLITTFFDHYLEQRMNYFDPLTRIPNRRMFQERIESSVKVQAIAIWRFNDLESYSSDYGYAFVDRMVLYMSSMLMKHLPPMTELYRTEPNCFIYVANDKTATIELHQKLQEISKCLKKGFKFEEHTISLQGVCVFDASETITSLEKLYLNVMTVLKHPSIGYQLDIVQYDPTIHTRNFTEELLRDMEEAMKNHDLFLVYQPKIAPTKNEVIGVEALIRWQHPRHGFLSPAIFLPIFEANNRMNDLTDWIINEVCIQLRDWQQEELLPKQVAINIPGPYLTSDRLMDVLKSTTKKYKICPKAIELEITETSFVKTITGAEKAVNEFCKEGFSVALDDFGTGVSSLSYLKRIPVTTLKIDKSFIDDVPSSTKDASIIKSVVQLGKSLNMEVVVEGVETEEQVQFLIEHCYTPHIQGYYFAKPMKPDELLNWCRAYQTPVKA